MNPNAKSIIAKILAVVVLMLLVSQPGFGLWRSLLDDHFNNDQSVAIQRWPWATPFPVAQPRWYWNPEGQFPRVSGCHRSVTSCWGWQDYIFNVAVDQNEFNGSIWCAQTNWQNPNLPFYPEDDDYQPNSRAWAWWGPADLRGAVAGGVSFWMNIDLENFARDSLSIVVFDDFDLATIPCGTDYNAANFRTNSPFGALRDGEGEFAGITSFNSTTGGWVSRNFSFDDLRVLNAAGEVVDSVSYLGHNPVYIGFVWHSDNIDIAGKGAFIDDVVVTKDDGLVDMIVEKIEYGYLVNEATLWSATPPSYGESCRFRLQWDTDGTGMIDTFGIVCLLDNQEIFREEREVRADAEESYFTETADFWTAIPGQHVLTFRLDVDDDIGEGDEGNNEMSAAIDIPWTPRPTMMFVQPAEDAFLPADVPFDFVAMLADSNEEDQSLQAFLYWTFDTTGFAADNESMFNYNYISHNNEARQGEWVTRFSFADLYADSIVKVGDTLFIGGFVSDDVFGNTSFAIATGRIIMDPLAVRDGQPLPVSSLMARAYPNPFNSEVVIEYALPTAGDMSLKIFDLAGRSVATLFDGRRDAGRFTAAWKPDGIGAGVYLVKLQSNTGTRLQKIVYTP